jgi:hypothetical protein
MERIERKLRDFMDLQSSEENGQRSATAHD